MWLDVRLTLLHLLKCLKNIVKRQNGIKKLLLSLVISSCAASAFAADFNDIKDVVALTHIIFVNREEAEKLRLSVKNERCYNFAGESKFHELPLLYSVSHCMVTNDSGPGHFSAVLDLPSFVIYGPETPKLYGSLGNSKAIYAGLACSPCVSAANHRKTPCTDNVCLKVISPEYVYKIIKPCLDKG